MSRGDWGDASAAGTGRRPHLVERRRGIRGGARHPGAAVTAAGPPLHRVHVPQQYRAFAAHRSIPTTRTRPRGGER